jgi:hypothetical protein
MSQGGGSSINIPAALVSRAQEDINFALRLLHRESRDEAIREAGVDLTDDQRSELYALLDEVANMSFQEALERIRDEELARFA